MPFTVITHVITYAHKYLSISLMIYLKRFLNILPVKEYVYLLISLTNLGIRTVWPHQTSWQVFHPSLFSERFCIKFVLVLLILFVVSTLAFNILCFSQARLYLYPTNVDILFHHHLA